MYISALNLLYIVLHDILSTTVSFVWNLNNQRTKA